ncbi:hypothetical protein VNO77_04809 [Canavalia gladiata]|uniref:Uncharacterized protein n=1 Tax=Canavalia gladiata TaxID=3824 RepID=A0AAN9R9E6_CANGL
MNERPSHNSQLDLKLDNTKVHSFYLELEFNFIWKKAVFSTSSSPFSFAASSILTTSNSLSTTFVFLPSPLVYFSSLAAVPSPALSSLATAIGSFSPSTSLCLPNINCFSSLSYQSFSTMLKIWNSLKKKGTMKVKMRMTNHENLLTLNWGKLVARQSIK